MSNNKPTAVAIIKFYPNKHVDVSLDTIRNITPRTLDIASNLLLKEYRGMKAQFIAQEHKDRRAAEEKARVKAEKDEKNFHKEEDARLAEATKSALDKVADIFKTKSKEIKEVT